MLEDKRQVVEDNWVTGMIIYLYIFVKVELQNLGVDAYLV